MSTTTKRSDRGRIPVLLAAAALGLGAVFVGVEEPETPRTAYGESVAVGEGTARAYVTMRGDVPEEIGIALDEAALAGLPDHHSPGGFTEHGHTTFARVLSLPAVNPTPFRHVLLNWNPGGHEPPGIYDLPHFDFHFYTIDEAERLRIDPADPDFQRKAERRPLAELVPEGYVMPAPLAFAAMGVHWVDPASPELNGERFTHTFIYGSWDGRFVFAEPMITREFLQTKPDVEAELPAPKKFAGAGYYPTRYAIRWDAAAREYRIALTGLVPRG